MGKRMATKAEANTVYAAGLIQGIALVTFPAASTIFTEPSQYGLSNTQQVPGTGHQATHLRRRQGRSTRPGRRTHRARPARHSLTEGERPCPVTPTSAT